MLAKYAQNPGFDSLDLQHLTTTTKTKPIKNGIQSNILYNPGVMVNLGCQVDYICNQLKPKQLDMFVEGFS